MTGNHEFAFGLDPTRASTRLLPKMQKSGAYHAVSFTQPDGVSGLIYGAEWSTTLQPANWIAIPDTGTGQQHTFSIPESASPRLFLRLKVSMP